MASYRKIGDKWRVELYVNGQRKSQRFNTKGAAQAWAQREEEAMRDGVLGTRHTLADALDRYAAEISPKKRGERHEVLRLKAIKRLPVSHRLISNVTATHIAEWRDMRLQDVTAGSVRREMGLLRSVFDIARREWKWIYKNPMDDVKKPPSPPHRDRIITDDEIAALTEKLNGQYRAAFLLALETGMRVKELCDIREQDIHEKFVTLHNTKNGTKRDVPLSTRARELVQVFDTTPANLSAVFYKAKKELKIDCTFHDTRHTACTRLAQKLSPLELARMLGHKDLKTTMIYYNEGADAIADKLG